MAEAITLVAEPFPFLPVNFKEKHFETNAAECDNLISTPSQDENKCQENIPRQTMSRKREATNILVECVKRRENELNMNSPQYDSSISVSCNKTMFDTMDSPSSTDEFDLLMVDSGIDSSKSCSPEHSLEMSSTFSTDGEIPLHIIDNDDPTVDLPASDQEKINLIQEIPVASLNLQSQKIIDDTPKVVREPLTQSLFTNRPPVLYFPAKIEEVSDLPVDLAALLQWKLSPITPVVLRENLTKVHFTFLEAETTEDWLGTYGKHLKSISFRKIKHFQKVNHYPGGFHLGRKDRLWENYRRMLSRHGPEHFNFFPTTYVLPAEAKQLRKVWNEEFAWIIKPCASARGTGVKVIHKWSQVPKNSPQIIQRYINDPYLINGTKFDLRLYILVPSVEPLRIYLYPDGLVRFASKKYSLANKSLKNRYVHLTNYSINRKSATYTSNDDETLCQGHKWSLKSFWVYMHDNGIDVERIKAAILDMIIKTVLSVEGPICRQMKMNAKSAYNCFELFGFDIMLDKNLHPWLLEVNISPSLHTRSVLDSAIKGPMVRDVLNIVGYELPKKSTDGAADCGYLKSSGNRHKPLQVKQLSEDERKKHSHFTSVSSDEEHSDGEEDILSKLTGDDLSCLMESEDELRRAGSFYRVFPSRTTHMYSEFFDHVRYYNVLLDAWERKYAHDRTAGIEYLKSSFKALSCQDDTLSENTQALNETQTNSTIEPSL